LSQKHEGWQVLAAKYDDGGFSGGNMDRPGLKKPLPSLSTGSTKEAPRIRESKP
jgi:DNA invertase Pin-like site-specific DNA recombinase